MRPSKVMAKAFKAAFHRMTHRALPCPVGSSDRVTKYKHFNAGWIQPVNATPDSIEVLRDGSTGDSDSGAA